MKKFAALTALIAPQVALAHPGHEHVVSATTHHTIEFMLVAGCVAVAAVIARLLLRRARSEEA